MNCNCKTSLLDGLLQGLGIAPLDGLSEEGSLIYKEYARIQATLKRSVSERDYLMENLLNAETAVTLTRQKKANFMDRLSIGLKTDEETMLKWKENE